MVKRPIDGAEPLFQAILKLHDMEECKAFFDDLCTIKEIQDLSQRYDVACMLAEGQNYHEIPLHGSQHGHHLQSEQMPQLRQSGIPHDPGPSQGRRGEQR